jgi:hypothetical protein
MKCQNCDNEAEYQCEITGLFSCYDCEHATKKNEFGIVTKYPCKIKKDHSHKKLQ